MPRLGGLGGLNFLKAAFLLRGTVTGFGRETPTKKTNEHSTGQVWQLGAGLDVGAVRSPFRRHGALKWV